MIYIHICIYIYTKHVNISLELPCLQKNPLKITPCVPKPKKWKMKTNEFCNFIVNGIHREVYIKKLY